MHSHLSIKVQIGVITTYAIHCFFNCQSTFPFVSIKMINKVLGMFLELLYEAGIGGNDGERVVFGATRDSIAQPLGN